MPDRELKNRVRFSTTLSIEVARMLKEYSKKTDIPVSKIVDKDSGEGIPPPHGSKSARGRTCKFFLQVEIFS